MAAQGYIGRAPGESSVIVARQTFTPTGITTNFTFASGYTVGYVDAYLNGARLVEGDDYTATDGSVVGLTTHAISGDVLELVVYKAFNLANVTGTLGDFSVPDKIVHTNDLDTAIRFPQADTFTVETAGSEVLRVDANSNVGIGTTNTLAVADPKNQSVLNVGVVTANSITAAAGTFGTLNVSGTLTYEDVANQDVVGFSTFQKGINVQGAGSTTTTLNVTGVTTMTGDVNLGGNLNIPDSIIHVGDSNTKIRFPANDTFTVETSGGEALRVDSSKRLVVGADASVQVAGSHPFVQHHGNKTTTNLAVAGYANNSGGSILALGASRSTTVGTPGTVVSNNDILGDIRFAGDDGTDINSIAAAIRGEVDGTPGSNDMPGRLIFATTADGAASATERLRITSDGIVDVTGKLRIDISSTGTVGSGAAEGIFLRNTNETDNNAVTIFGGADDYSAAASAINFINVDHSANAGAISFDTRTTGNSYGERLRIDSSGRLLLGTTTEGEASADNFTVADSGNSGITIRSGTSDKG